MSRGVLPNDIRLTGGRIRCRVIALALANSRSPSAPCTRPNPDSPTPPNGSAGTTANPSTELIEVIPLRSARAASIAAERSRANTADPSPYRLRLASVTASARPGTGVTVTVGPNVSSRTAALSSGTSASTTGRRYGPGAASAPPTTRRPPRASASATCPATTSAWAADVIGPYAAPPSGPGRSPATRRASLSRNVW